MTTKEVKQWLSRGYWLRQETERLERARRETYDRLTSITATGGGTVVSGTKDPHKFDALVDLDAELERRIGEIDRIRLEILGAIKAIENDQYRIILYDRYYEHVKWDNIAMKMHYHKRTVEKMHGDALKAIEPIIVKIMGK